MPHPYFLKQKKQKNTKRPTTAEDSKTNKIILFTAAYQILGLRAWRPSKTRGDPAKCVSAASAAKFCMSKKHGADAAAGRLEW
jgi:hypothetical protein